jgi:hypothetical protein
VSCSHHAEAAFATRGFVRGLAATVARLRACRPGYEFVLDDRGWAVRCVDGSLVALPDLSSTVRCEVAAIAWAVARPVAAP